MTIGLGGVTVSVIGAALFVRYSLTGFLRFWMARQSYDLTVLADRLLEPGSGRDLSGDLGGDLDGDLDGDLSNTDRSGR